jgi:hypothetical protein
MPNKRGLRETRERDGMIEKSWRKGEKLEAKKGTEE